MTFHKEIGVTTHLYSCSQQTHWPVEIWCVYQIVIWHWVNAQHQSEGRLLPKPRNKQKNGKQGAKPFGDI